MYRNMRDNVFHTNEREDEIAERLAASGYTPEQVQGFRAMAQQSSTPDQLETAARQYGYLDESGAPT